MVASQNGHLEAVLALIRSGTEVNHTDKVVKYSEHVVKCTICDVQHIVSIGLSICLCTFECVYLYNAQFREYALELLLVYFSLLCISDG